VIFFTDHWKRRPAAGFGHEEPSDAQVEWLNSDPPPGEVLVDTGMASAEDCQKLRHPLGAEGDLEREIARMTMAVERTKALFKTGDPAAEATRVNDMVADALNSVGLDPEKFGVSLPPAVPNPSGGQPLSGGAP
jgi:hypothetical protein